MALIAQDRQALLDRAGGIDDLRKLRFGLGIGWGDVKLYEANGFHVREAKYDSLFAMVAGFDPFPRGSSEVFAEFESHSRASPRLAIENESADLLSPALLFLLQQARRRVAETHRERRRTIRINNHMLPKETPLNEPALWFDPAKY